MRVEIAATGHDDSDVTIILDRDSLRISYKDCRYPAGKRCGVQD
jgi:hypothetical protein